MRPHLAVKIGGYELLGPLRMFLPDIVLILNRPYLPDLRRFAFSNIYAFYDGRMLFSTAESQQV